MENVLITGVSHGIGNELAKRLLHDGYRVFGVSRTLPQELLQHENFFFRSIDLSEIDRIADKLGDFFIKEHKLKRLKYVFLNAGLFSQRIGYMQDVPLEDIDYLMRVNVWSYKAILDLLLKNNVEIDTCVASSSIAGVRARAGNSGYAISKAALNMMMRLYALERQDVFFAVLGLCNVYTRLSRHIGNTPLEGRFPEIEKLRERASGTGYLVSAEQRASDICTLLANDIKTRVNSGEFVEIRDLAGQRMATAAG